MYVYVYRGLSVLFAFHSALLTEAGRCWASLLDHLHFIWKEAGRSALEETDCVDFARQNFLSSRSLERLDSYNQSGAAAFWEPRLTTTQPLLPTSPTFPGSEAARGVHCSVSGTQALHTTCVSVCVTRPVPHPLRKPWVVWEMSVSSLSFVALDSSEKDPSRKCALFSLQLIRHLL